MSTPVPLPRRTPLSALRRRPPLSTRLDTVIRHSAPDRLSAHQAAARLYEIQKELDRTTSRRRLADLYVAATETYVSAPRDPATDLAMGRVEGHAERARATRKITETPFSALLRDYARDPDPTGDSAPIVNGYPEDVVDVLGDELAQKHELLQTITAGTRAGLQARETLADQISRSSEPAALVHSALAADNMTLNDLAESMKVGEVSTGFVANTAAQVHAKWGGVADAIVDRADQLGGYATTGAPFTVNDFTDLVTTRQQREAQRQTDQPAGHPPTEPYVGWDDSRETISRAFVTHPAGFEATSDTEQAIAAGVDKGSVERAALYAAQPTWEAITDQATEDAMSTTDDFVELSDASTDNSAAGGYEISVVRDAARKYAAWSGIDNDVADSAADLGGLALQRSGSAHPDHAAATAAFRQQADTAIAAYDAADPTATTQRDALRARTRTAHNGPDSAVTPQVVHPRAGASAARVAGKPFQVAPSSHEYASPAVAGGAHLTR